MKQIISTSAAQTFSTGQRMAKKLRGGEVLALVGDLGTGKTVMTRGIATGLGVTGRIVSPTFVLMRVYPVKNRGRITQLVHIDAYRIQHAHELLDIGLDDYLGKPDTVTVIEWADRVKKILPRKTITVELDHGSTVNRRKVLIKNRSSR
ncbi:MAG: tRNA (adenosine(37)-N6)-threonylcarbamoyltransferase complex ATPase subunit type 1 TsaE [Patescibacteria group bacterium]|nr:tRNA (adenosine(37)-N6)-threonylcarbamoyltransferase complex ATPase subunit type 1 TsaE [Patescibacteria group bacterium]